MNQSLRRGGVLVAIVLTTLFLAGAAAAQECDLDDPDVTQTVVYGGQTIPVGVAQISNDNCDLIITVIGQNGWEFSEYHIYAGEESTPLNKGGNPRPGRFPYKGEFSGTVADFEVRIPLDAVVEFDEDECEDAPPAVIAIHVVAIQSDSGQEETGWAFGPRSFPKRWGWELDYFVQCEDDGPDDPNN